MGYGETYGGTYGSIQVIKEKEKAYIKQKPTEIVCKYFIDALEKDKYNWNW